MPNKKNYDTYKNDVLRGKIEGEWEEIKSQGKSYIQDFQKYGEFKILALKKDGKSTGYAKCTRCFGNKGLKIFSISDLEQEKKKKDIERHLKSYHYPASVKKEIEEKDLKRKADQTLNMPQKKKEETVKKQRLMTQYGPAKKLSASFVKKIKTLMSTSIADKALALGHYHEDCIMNIFEEIWKEFDRNPLEIRQFCVSRRQQKREIFARSKEISVFINGVAEALTTHGCIHIAFDHKMVKHKTSDYSNDVLGIELIIIDDDGKRFSYVLGLQAVTIKNADETASIVLQHLKVLIKQIF